MADQLGPEKIEEHRAMLHAIGTDDWKQAGTIAAEIANVFIGIANAFSDDLPADPRTPESFIPGLRSQERTKSVEVDPSVERAARAVEARVKRHGGH